VRRKYERSGLERGGEILLSFQHTGMRGKEEEGKEGKGKGWNPRT